VTLDGIAILFAFGFLVLSYALNKRFGQLDERLKKIEERLKFIIERQALKGQEAVKKLPEMHLLRNCW
jgi:hypothetical protein